VPTLGNMPYNTDAIPPRRDVTGQAQLPLARVKKIIAHDGDINMCSNNAAFVITIATEMFIQYFAEQGHNVVKSERKPRRNIQYKDLASAVARIDDLQFLEDVVPRTVPYKTYRQAKEKNQPSNGLPMEHGQTTLDGKKPVIAINGANGIAMTNPSEDQDDDGGASAADPNTQLEMEYRGSRGISGPLDHLNEAGTEDVEMT